MTGSHRAAGAPKQCSQNEGIQPRNQARLIRAVEDRPSRLLSIASTRYSRDLDDRPRPRRILRGRWRRPPTMERRKRRQSGVKKWKETKGGRKRKGIVRSQHSLARSLARRSLTHQPHDHCKIVSLPVGISSHYERRAHNDNLKHEANDSSVRSPVAAHRQKAVHVCGDCVYHDRACRKNDQGV